MCVVNAKQERKLRKEVCGRVLQAVQLPSKERKMAAPCRVCGVGVSSDYRVCIPCGGRTVKQRLSRKHKKAKKIFELVLLELKETQLEK